MNRDFAEILSELSAAGADFLIVGVHALAAHVFRGVPYVAGELRPSTSLLLNGPLHR